jgi:uncharacterized protein VirK/YbjX
MDEQLEELRRLRALLLQARDALIPYMQCIGHVCINQEHQVYRTLYNQAAQVVMAIDKESKL